MFSSLNILKSRRFTDLLLISDMKGHNNNTIYNVNYRDVHMHNRRRSLLNMQFDITRLILMFLFSQRLMIIVIISRHGRPVNQNIAGIMNL